jgi:Tol biopolymer transport system component
VKVTSLVVLATTQLFVVSAVAADLPPTQRLQSIDVFQLEYTDDVQISPDGSRIVYVRVSHDIMTDRARRNLWIVNVDGTNNRPLRSEAKNFMSPRWSPDGTRLAYVSAAEGSPQLYVRWIDTGQTALLTNLVQAPNAIAWSADGKSIAFTQLGAGEEAAARNSSGEARGRAMGATSQGDRLGGVPRGWRGISGIGIPARVRRVRRGRHAAPADRRRVQ